MRTLKYSAMVENCTILGPGNRAVLWVHGCPFNCPECIGDNFKTGKGRQIATREIANWYLSTEAEGLTISGGEPMMQAAALAEMMDMIRAERDCGLIVYTGFVYEDLVAKNNPDITNFLAKIDLLVDGPYIQEKDIDQPYRGSSDQRLLTLTDRYAKNINGYYNAGHHRQMEIRISGERTLMIGVPDKKQASIWRHIKSLGG
jgi:anaerobic ribonucleoside-triphosphate reductase activating protein